MMALMALVSMPEYCMTKPASAGEMSPRSAVTRDTATTPVTTAPNISRRTPSQRLAKSWAAWQRVDRSTRFPMWASACAPPRNARIVSRPWSDSVKYS